MSEMSPGTHFGFRPIIFVLLGVVVLIAVIVALATMFDAVDEPENSTSIGQQGG
jgi:uncharacterized membrane protein